VFVLDKLLTGGIGFVLRRISEAVDAERLDDSVLREDLLEAQLKLEQGEIDEEEYAAIEGDVFARMRELRERSRGDDERAPLEASRLEIEAIDADVGDERAAPRALPAAPRDASHALPAAPRAASHALPAAPKRKKRARRR
jgi:hypothetical protein